MLGYLLNGDTAEVFENIAQKLSCALDPVPEHASRNNRVSDRARTVPSGKNYPASFSCYHLILEYRLEQSIVIGRSIARDGRATGYEARVSTARPSVGTIEEIRNHVEGDCLFRVRP